MSNNRERIQAKIDFLQQQLQELKDYFYVPETYQYLIGELDTQHLLLKQLEVQEQFAAIDCT
jgi:hypothetical protein